MVVPAKPISIDVALQGGGAHGAFTWGALDRLLEEEDLKIAALSGASAGAMNAVVAAAGLMSGGPAEAKATLHRFWSEVNEAARTAFPIFPLIEAFPGVLSAAGAWWSTLTGGMVNLRANPAQGRATQDMLGEILTEVVDFEALRRGKGPQLFISATNARTGAARIFTREEMTPEVLLASACLPGIFPPVSIDDADYWDGGYSANPPLLPLVRESPVSDLLLITINPLNHETTPTDPEAIAARINELTFNQGLLREMRGLALLKQELRAQPLLVPKGLMKAVRDLRFHEIHDEAHMSKLDQDSKMMPSWPMMEELHDYGHTAADNWLGTHRKDLGLRSTMDLTGRYL
ncbi:patatin-like phospholipase family protein [Pseudooceanicola sp. CBS1P-1]|uniref:Patatin-like phospholipase family protein n=1 Tax=Pseudooceanicola albus TaxID=2692189 RepID=A0A6L7G6N6_9RHOB|nr:MULTISPECIES: patatin-like phospholipase family protein [Pseudooceanicola]MBT9383009.1 patatin-like phospholipase family protein [Pseudooceanicola endophyticus]MXN19197.1 patatin-like phospholipase family protein [Pseudooceanicola albus]